MYEVLVLSKRLFSIIYIKLLAPRLGVNRTIEIIYSCLNPMRFLLLFTPKTRSQAWIWIYRKWPIGQLKSGIVRMCPRRFDENGTFRHPICIRRNKKRWRGSILHVSVRIQAISRVFRLIIDNGEITIHRSERLRANKFYLALSVSCFIHFKPICQPPKIPCPFTPRCKNRKVDCCICKARSTATPTKSVNSLYLYLPCLLITA